MTKRLPRRAVFWHQLTDKNYATEIYSGGVLKYVIQEHLENGGPSLQLVGTYTEAEYNKQFETREHLRILNLYHVVSMS